MPRPYTLFTGQWADLPFEEVARLASDWGYDGLEIAVSGDHLDAWRWDEPGYAESKLAVLEKYNLKVWAISNHLKGQAVCDNPIDFRHRDIVGPSPATGSHRSHGPLVPIPLATRQCPAGTMYAPKAELEG